MWREEENWAKNSRGLRLNTIIQVVEVQHKGVDRPVVSLPAAHHGRHNQMGGYHCGGVYWRTPAPKRRWDVKGLSLVSYSVS